MKRFGIKIDWRLLAPAIILVILGLTTLSAVNVAFFRTQLINAFLCIVVFLIFSQLTIDSLRTFYTPIYIASVIILGVVLFIGFESKGAVRWVEIFGVSIQFSELLKPFLAISFAGYLAQQGKMSFRYFLNLFLLLFPVFALIFFQPDLGNAMIYAIVMLFTLFVYGFPLLWFAAVSTPFFLMAPFIWQALREYQKQRILTFLHPTSDPLGVSYNAIQAMIAVGSGMLVGKGISEGTQSGLRFLPERHTDFIFATFTEGFGFVGAMVMLGAFFFLFFEIYRIYKGTDDLFHRLFASITFSFILVHMLVNIGMNVGVVPIVGVTLPFVSFGGSSLLSNFIFLGLLNAIQISQKRGSVLEIR